MRWITALALVPFAFSCPGSVYAQDSPESRAVAHLIREVPSWARENHCHSCHNDGDGLRALLLAKSMNFGVPDNAIGGSLNWLRDPSRWDEGAKHPMASDTKLARLQFAVALDVARSIGEIRDLETIRLNAELLARDQEEDGAWRVANGDLPGSPITWGTSLATCLAIGVLKAADAQSFESEIIRATEWLRKKPPTNTLEHAARVMAFPRQESLGNESLRHLLLSQTSDGGWGAQRRTPAEAFDTAAVLLALVNINQTAPVREALVRGREYLISQQLESGGWVETTRPSGSTSYAHHVSTTAWATMALLRTNLKRH